MFIVFHVVIFKHSDTCVAETAGIRCLTLCDIVMLVVVLVTMVTMAFNDFHLFARSSQFVYLYFFSKRNHCSSNNR